MTVKGQRLESWQHDDENNGISCAKRRLETQAYLRYQVAFWSIQPFGHNRHGSKIGRLCPFGGNWRWIPI